jgi:hypothetical protein
MEEISQNKGVAYLKKMLWDLEALQTMPRRVASKITRCELTNS